MNLFTYRGKRLDNGKWTYGDKVAIRNSKGVETIGIKDTIYHVNDGYCNVIPDEIDPATLGVCWGMKDNNGKDVYTKQEVLYTFHNYCASGYFQFVKDSFVLIDKNGSPSLFDDGSIEIIEEE